MHSPDSSAAASSDGDYDSSSSDEGSFFSTVSNFFDLTKSKPSKKKSATPNPAGGGLVDYINNLVQHDAQVQFVKGFKFRPEEQLIYPFSCNLVSRKELVECTGFVSYNFICFLGVKEQVDDRGHKVLLRVVIPLRGIERILSRVCVVKGIYDPDEDVDAILLNTATARHQIVWVDEIDQVTKHLTGAWEKARQFDRVNDALPVSLILNPEFASLTASSTEGSPRNRLMVQPLLVGSAVGDQEQEDAVSEEYDSEHAESIRSMERQSNVSSDSVKGVSKKEGSSSPVGKEGEENWSEVKI